MIATPTLNIFSNNNNYTSYTPHPSSSQKTSIDPRLIPALPSKNQPSCSSISLIAHAAENRTLVTSNDSQAHLTSSTTINLIVLSKKKKSMSEQMDASNNNAAPVTNENSEATTTLTLKVTTKTPKDEKDIVINASSTVKQMTI
ncbi:unnamed protein product [Rotaria socialis]|uniref:Uncharacterized protein n=1 Tax=Rotaria socialis TaxID=392032 RepID=A0A817WB38_9BILA|nr:unnamed protein product [Rotaria socialis]